MKTIVLKTNLTNGLSAVDGSVTESNTLPILKNVLIKTFNNQLKISATNLELGVSKFISGKIIEEGSITVPFKTFSGIINHSDSERINLEIENNNLIIKTDNYTAKIQGSAPEEYPIIPKIDNSDYYFEINNDLFKKSLKKVINCCQISEIRPEISGVLFDFQITVLKLAATDSFRLSEKIINSNQYQSNINKGFKTIIPLKTIQEYLKIFPNDGSVKIFIDPNQILFKGENLEMISRLIDGNYPDYEQIIPKETDTEFQIPREHFVNAVKLVSNLSGKIDDIKIKFGDNKKTIEIYSANQYLGENNYLIPTKIKGKDFKEVIFNWRFLMDGLKTINSPEIHFGINGESKPAILKNKDDNSYLYIIMPIKV